MGDLPWEWTERDSPGVIDLMSFDKNWMKLVCDMGLNLRVVITMREPPTWLQNDKNQETTSFNEIGKCIERENVTATAPSSAHPHVWDSMQHSVFDWKSPEIKAA